MRTRPQQSNAAGQTPEEIGKKMEALQAWGALHPFLWALKPLGSAIPYFCSVSTFPDDSAFSGRVTLYWGWQSFHDYVRLRHDASFGCKARETEIPSLMLTLFRDGTCALTRTDEGHLPRRLASDGDDAVLRALAARLLWEVYGLMLRLESDPQLPMKYASEQALFSRHENESGEWVDAPLVISNPPPYVEKVGFPKEDLKRARDLPIIPGAVLAVDFCACSDEATIVDSPTPISYRFRVADGVAKCVVWNQTVSVTVDCGLRDLWQSVPLNLLAFMVRQGKLPSEIRVRSQRLFRFLRALCLELPIKLVCCENLPFLI